MSAHIEEALERGSSPDEARQALGRAFRYSEQSRDIKLLPWLDSLASDIVFGWRQLNRRRAATAAAILSLGLAIGATTAAFRLVDAVLFRNLPVAEPERLYYLAITNFLDRDGRPDYRDDFDYPTFRRYRETVGDKADLMVVGFSSGQDVTFGSDENTEKLYRQYVSGNVFSIFGLQPTLGRLLTPNDDAVPGAHPVAVISYDFWSRHFGGDPAAVGKRFRMGPIQFEIVGVAPKGFTGTEPGTVTDVFLPATMNVGALNSPGYSWFRLWARLKPGTAPEQIRQMLQAVLSRDNAEFLKDFPNNAPKERVDALLRQSVLLFPAAAGASNLKKDYRRPLIILSALVCLVLLVACANIGNLLTAQAAARAREMALRVSIGAGRARLVQLLLVESALLAAAPSLLGVLFSLWTAPFIVSMLAPPERPVRLVLAVDWRTLAFSAVLSLTVTFLFGLAPALRASSVKPMSALKGGEDPYSRPRLMKSLVAAQMAFCVLVQFMAGLFITTFNRLSTRPLGFAPQHVLLLQTGVRGKNQPAETWMQVADRLRELPGVQSATFAGWGLLTDNRWTGTVQVPGRALDPRSPYLLDVKAGFFETMRIGWIAGRDFRVGDVPPKLEEHGGSAAGVAIVNEAFARTSSRVETRSGRLPNCEGARRLLLLSRLLAMSTMPLTAACENHCAQRYTFLLSPETAAR